MRAGSTKKARFARAKRALENGEKTACLEAYALGAKQPLCQERSEIAPRIGNDMNYDHLGFRNAFDRIDDPEGRVR